MLWKLSGDTRGLGIKHNIFLMSESVRNRYCKVNLPTYPFCFLVFCLKWYEPWMYHRANRKTTSLVPYFDRGATRSSCRRRPGRPHAEKLVLVPRLGGSWELPRARVEAVHRFKKPGSETKWHTREVILWHHASWYKVHCSSCLKIPYVACSFWERSETTVMATMTVCWTDHLSCYFLSSHN
jgi:hypothetical protein